MRETFLHFSPPFLGEEEIEEVVEALRSGWISRGPRTGAFEEAFAEYVGAEVALALNSCTSALHLAMLALEIGPGDEVIVPTMTFCASANVVEHVGARPVLVDVEPDTLNLDPEAVEAAVTGRTRAVIVVHFAGHPAEMDRIDDIAARRGLAIVEDAAHALPASYRGRTIGSGKNLTAFSFYATKNLTTGEGGMLTGDSALVQAARLYSLHGMSGGAWNRYSEKSRWFYEVMVPGYKYNMSDVQAALGLRQLERLESMQSRRREIVDRYQCGFRDVTGLRLPVERPDVEVALHLYALRVEPGGSVDRDGLIEGLTRRNIGTSVHFIPLHLHHFYRDKYGHRPEDFPVAQEAYRRLVTLPLHPGLTDEDVDDVVESVRDVVGVGQD